MKMGAIIGLVATALVIGAGAAAYVFRADLSMRVFQRAAEHTVGENLPAELPDGLHAIFCGTGAPLPDRSRAGPCTAVLAGQHLFVFDAGEGAAETLALMGVTAGDIETVFLTHLHSDHFDGLAPLALQHWATVSAHAPLHVVGPVGAARVANGLNEAYAIDSGYRTAHHGPEVMPPSGFGLQADEFTVPENDEPFVVYDSDGVRITAFRVDHSPTQAVGYRIEYGGRSLVISGDTARSQSLVTNAEGADLLVHEALEPQLDQIMHDAAVSQGRTGVGAILHDILSYHTSPEDAGRAAADAHVGALALTHILPPTPVPGLTAVFERDARRHFSGPIWVARDGDVISLPVSGGIERSHHLRF